ncbi:MAG: TonB-dependent receptor [Verrucomicrobia bacterium]|nr:MAG: TonB-dependent receptor [Verrucomicrobiota bacterium]
MRKRHDAGLPLQLFSLALALTWPAVVPAQVQAPEAPAVSVEELMKMEIPVVEAASKYEQKITEAPSSVTVISRDEVQKYGYRTLSDILEGAPGLYVSYDRNYSYLGLRGFELGDFYTRNDRFLLLVDGHRVNNSLTDGAGVGTDFILDADLIERVEVIRGPGSSLYGANAFFGVINVVTRRGRDFSGNGAEVSGEYASYDTYKGRATYGNRFMNGVELLLSGTIYDSEGHKSLYYPEYDQRQNPNNFFARNNGFAEHADNDDYKSAFGSVSFNDFSLEGAYITREKRNPTGQFFTTFDDNRFRTTDDRGYANLKYAHDFPEFADVTAQVYYDRADGNFDEPFTNFPALSSSVFNISETAEWAGGELQLTRQFWERITLTLGGEYRDDFHQRETRGANVYEGSRQNQAVYLQGDFAVLTNLHLNAGFRYDQYRQTLEKDSVTTVDRRYDPEFNPRAAAIYNPIGQAVFKLIYGTAFRNPDFRELIDASPDTDPERIKTYEAVYEQGIGSHLRSSIGGFYNKIDDLIRFSGIYVNATNTVEAKGVELALDGFWAGGLRGRASYSFQTTEDKSTGKALIDSPQHTAKLNASVPLFKDKIFGGLEVLFASSRTTAVESTDAPAYAFLNLTLFSQNLIKGLDVSASVYNLLDKKYSDPATAYHQQALIAQDGRTFRVKLTYRF